MANAVANGAGSGGISTQGLADFWDAFLAAITVRRDVMIDHTALKKLDRHQKLIWSDAIVSPKPAARRSLPHAG